MPTVIPTDELLVTWGGWPGAPGYTVFRAVPNTGTRAPIITFLQALLTYLPLNLTLTVPATGRTIDASTGTLLGTWSAGTTQTLTGTSTAQYAAPSGACVTWKSTTIWRGRYIVGRTFLVPLTIAVYQNDGTIVEATRTAIQTAAQNLISQSGGNLVIWSRPRQNPVADADFGMTGKASVAEVHDRVAVLTHRRA